MQLKSVDSATIRCIGFEEDFRMAFGQKSLNILRIVFTSENVFDYYGVDLKVYEEFIKAESKGKFFHTNIKNKYQYEKANL